MGKITIIDYGMGNLRSVQKKFLKVGAEVDITSDLDQIMKAEKLLLPGVGHFANGVKKLKERGIWELLNKKVLKEKTPILGICLGMQLMARYSEEGNAEGLGWFDAEVVNFTIRDKLKYKVPHMGWNNTIIVKENSLMKDLDNESMYYFVHSYYMKCNNKKDILTTTGYEDKFVSAIQKDNIYGTQFHPEKSHDTGEKLIKNFVELI
jgi:imidazole glycerol-phosphate synthase subunit HisH